MSEKRDWRKDIENFVAAQKLEWSVKNPETPWIGPHVAEVALQEYDALKQKLDEAMAIMERLVDDGPSWMEWSIQYKIAQSIVAKWREEKK